MLKFYKNYMFHLLDFYFSKLERVTTDSKGQGTVLLEKSHLLILTFFLLLNCTTVVPTARASENKAKILEDNILKAENLGNTANELAKQGKNKEAIDLYLKGFKLNPKEPLFPYSIGQCYSELKNYKEAKKWYLLALKMKPNDYASLVNCGITYNNLSKYNLAINCHKKAIKLRPTKPEAWHNLASCYGDTGKHDLAIENYHQALKYDKFSGKSLTCLAEEYFEIGEYKKSESYFKKAIEIEPSYAAYLLQGKLYKKLNRLDEALKSFENAKKYTKRKDSMLNLQKNITETEKLKRSIK